VILETGPLWFVQVLLIFTIVLVAAIQIIKKIKKNSYINWNTDLNFPANYMLWIFILTLAAVAFFLRLRWPIGTAVSNLQICFFPQYAFMFAVGIIACMNNWFEKINRRIARFWLAVLIVAVISWPVIIFFSGAFAEGDITILAGGLHWQAFLYALWESVVCVSISIIIIYFFRKKFNHQNKFTKTLSSSSYAVFMIHPMIIVPLSYSLIKLDLHPLIKFLVVSVTGVPLSFLIGSLIRKIPFLRKIL
jgi:surface polysaccharide O-acyltransferase-like enzyme